MEGKHSYNTTIPPILMHLQILNNGLIIISSTSFRYALFRGGAAIAVDAATAKCLPINCSNGVENECVLLYLQRFVHAFPLHLFYPYTSYLLLLLVCRVLFIFHHICYCHMCRECGQWWSRKIWYVCVLVLAVVGTRKIPNSSSSNSSDSAVAQQFMICFFLFFLPFCPSI